MTELIAEMEALGMEFSWDPKGGWNWIGPILAGQQQQRLRELKQEAAAHWDAFDAAVEVHLWRKDGTIR